MPAIQLSPRFLPSAIVSHVQHRDTLTDDTQALAWLQCKVDQTRAGLAGAPSGAYAGMDAPSLISYAAGALAVAGWLAGCSALAGAELILPAFIVHL